MSEKPTLEELLWRMKSPRGAPAPPNPYLMENEMTELIQTAYQSAATYDQWLATRRQLSFHDWFWIVYVPNHLK
jgi:hypothetical protein